MLKFELLDNDVKPAALKEGDHITIHDKLYRVVNNFPVVGGGYRMLMLAFYTHEEPTGYMFEKTLTHGPSFKVFRKID